MEVAHIALDHVPTVDLSGAEAKRGDIVQNIVTGRYAVVLAVSQFGRLVTSLGAWERTSARVRLTRATRKAIYLACLKQPEISADERAAMETELSYV